MCAECVAEAQAAHRPLTGVPTLPCPRHGAPASLTNRQEQAWQIYCDLMSNHQYHQHDKTIRLDPAAIDVWLRTTVRRRERAEVLAWLTQIHQIIYA